MALSTNKGNIINAMGLNAILHVLHHEFSFLHFCFLQKQSFLVVMKHPFLLRVMRVMKSMIVVKVGGAFVCCESG